MAIRVNNSDNIEETHTCSTSKNRLKMGKQAFVLRFSLVLVLSLLWSARATHGEKEGDQVSRLPSHKVKAKTKSGAIKGERQWDFIQGLSQEDAIVKWIQSLEGGFVNNQVFEIQRIQNDDTSLNPEFDFLATTDISKGTVLMEIPPQAMIGEILTSYEESALIKFTKRAKEASKNIHIPTCMAIERIANERQEKTSSKYHPYLEFVFGSGNPKHLKPSEWSDPAQAKFWEMTGQYGTAYAPAREHYGIGVTDICKEYKQIMLRSRPRFQANESPEDDEIWLKQRASIESQAYSYFSKNAWGTSLIPLFDMIPHRNGKWKNVEAQYVDTKTNTPVTLKPRERRFQGFRRQGKENDNNKNKLVVYAHRDIAKGEPLRISINQCEHLGCEYLKLNYTTSDLLADTGILEEYPRRWSFEMNEYKSNVFVIEIDRDSTSKGDSQRKTVRVLQSNHPHDELYKHAFLDVSIKRWRDLVKRELEEYEKSWNITTAQEKHEYDTIHAYQKAYTEAFELAWIHRNDHADPHRINHNTTQNAMTGYDDLSQEKGPAFYSKGEYMVCLEGDVNYKSKLLGRIDGFYQKIEYYYEPEADNTYMSMATWLHSGSNFRAHYHESVIHGALQYVKNPKRVLYIGGGDNMILAELFKYDSIEKIVGLELDQQVCRSSMKYFGTSPYYHDERVEWWYGNGAISLQLIPEDYFESFDLVLVDLLTDVADAIKVRAGLSLSEVAALLMKPHGVLARNDDFLDRSEISQHLANRVVMYDFLDAPRLCEIGVTLASNSVDFVKGPRYDHGIETLVRNTKFKEERFAGWSRYYDSSNNNKNLEAEKFNFEAKGAIVCKKMKETLKEDYGSSSSTSSGLLLVIEAENVTMSLEPEKLPHLHEMIEGVARKHGLFPLATSYRPEKDVNSFTLLCERGYIRMQTYPQFEYVAFDLVLWGESSFVDKSKYIQTDLIASVGGANTEGSVSKFRVVTGGMPYAQRPGESNNDLVGKALQYYCGDQNTEIDVEDEDGKTNEKHIVLNQVGDQSFLFPQLLSDIAASISSGIDQKSFFVIFCGKRDDEECQSYSSVSSTSLALDNEQLFVPIYSCESFDQMPACESEIKEILQDFVSEQKLFDGFILDPSVSLDMGKIIHKIFNNTLYQSQIFEQSFSGVVKGGEESWMNVLLDRFRTEIAIGPSVQMTGLELSNGTHSESWSILSVQNYDFLARLQNTLESIQRKSGLVIKTRKILDSIKPLKSDWEPMRPTDYAFFREDVMDQWLGQEPVANQFFLQMEVDSKSAPVKVDEVVLVGEEFLSDGVMAADPRGFLFDYFEGTIVEVKEEEYIAKIEPYELKDGRKVEFFYKSTNDDETIPRHQIRKISRTEKDRQLSIGDLVLVKRRSPSTKEVIPVAWYAANIIGMNENGFTVRSKYRYEGEDDSDFFNIPPDDIILYSESPEFTFRKEGVYLEALKFAFEESAYESGFAPNDALYETFKVKNGYIVTFVSQIGSGIMKWDGVGSVEVNVLATGGDFEEDLESSIILFSETFLSNLPSLRLTAKDSFPRGFGKVVNFQHEMVEFEDDGVSSHHEPMWTKDEL